MPTLTSMSGKAPHRECRDLNGTPAVRDPATVRLALADEGAVAARHAPSASAHQTGSSPAAPPNAVSSPFTRGSSSPRRGCCRAPRTATRSPSQHGEHRDGRVAARGREQTVAMMRSSPVFDTPLHHHEQADEEEERDPLHLAEARVQLVRLLLGVRSCTSRSSSTAGRTSDGPASGGGSGAVTRRR